MSSRDIGAQIVDKRRNWEARVEMVIFKRPSNELSAYDKLVYAILCGHANRDGNAMLYVRTIAEEASCSDRQVRRALCTLEARHLLVRRAQSAAGQGQTFNIYEVYGFDEYSFGENPIGNGNGDAEPPCQAVIPPMTDSHAPACQSVTPPLSTRQAPHDSQAGPTNVFEQLFFNSSKKEQKTPPTPQRGAKKGGISESENQRPQKPKHDTEAKAEPSKPNQEAELFESILETYNAILPELPQAGKITASRAKTLRERIREDPAGQKQKLAWWKNFFSRVREFPWPMGKNASNWRADFDWLISEDGMQKVIEGGFTQAPRIKHSSEEFREWQKRYTDERGIVDARALLRDWRARTSGTTGTNGATRYC
jgi:hypothetical protein